jgi:hypothetical protein
MRNDSAKVVEKIKTHFYVQEVLAENRDVCEITWNNKVEPDRVQMTIWRMGTACWMTKTADA